MEIVFIYNYYSLKKPIYGKCILHMQFLIGTVEFFSWAGSASKYWYSSEASPMAPCSSKFGIWNCEYGKPITKINGKDPQRHI